MNVAKNVADRSSANADQPIISRLFGVFYLSRISLAVIAGALIGSWLIYLFLNEELTHGYSQAILGISRAEAALFGSIFYSVLFQTVIALSIIALLAIYYSNKVLGPVYRITRTFDEIAEGDVRSEAKIRVRDELQSIPETVNGMRSDIAAFVDDAGARCGELTSLIERLDSAGAEDKKELEDKLKESIGSLKSMTEKMKFDE